MKIKTLLLTLILTLIGLSAFLSSSNAIDYYSETSDCSDIVSPRDDYDYCTPTIGANAHQRHARIAGVWTPVTGPTGPAGGYATIQDEGSALTTRAIVNFTGAGVTCVDNGGSTRTDCTIPAAAAGPTGPAGPGISFVVKSADESRVSSIVLTSDNHLTIPVTTSAVYHIRCPLLLNGTATNPDFKFGWLLPTGVSLFWHNVVDGGSTTGWMTRSTGSTPTALLTATSTLSVASFNGTSGMILEAILTTTSTSGDVHLQWAQNSNNANTIKLLKGSMCEYLKTLP